MKKIVVIFFIIISISSVYSQINKLGIPFITNYSPENYQADPQNWSIVQDNRGVMYFANNDGVLEFDGINWRKIQVASNNVVLSLAVDSAGTVFVGAIGEFGFLQSNKLGKLEYVSLSDKLDSTYINFNDIWKIFITDNKVFFGTIKYLFYYDYKQVGEFCESPDNYALFYFKVNKNILLGDILNGLMIVKKDSLTQAKFGDFFSRKYIMGISPYKKNKYIISTYMNGIYVYDIISGIDTINQIIPIETNNILKNATILQSSKQDSKNYVFATQEKGTIILDENFNILNIIEETQGLQDKTAYFSYLFPNTISSSLWLAMNNGISFIELNSPFRKFDKKHGIEGNIYDITKFDNKMYIATNMGVYYLDYSKNGFPTFNKVINENGKSTLEAWTFYTFAQSNGSKMLLLGTNFGLFNIEDSIMNLIPIKDIKNDFNIRTLTGSSSNPNILYIGEAGNFKTLLLQSDGTWILHKKSPSLHFEVYNIVEDIENNIWLSTFSNGIIKITSNKDTIFYDEKSGLPGINNISFYRSKDKLFFCTTNGLYNYSEEKDSFLQVKNFESHCELGSNGIYKMQFDIKGNIWLIRENEKKEWIEKIYYEENNIPKIDSVPFKRVNLKSIQAIYPDSSGIIWIGTSEGLFTYDDNYDKNYHKQYNTLIRKVTLNEDSIIFYGTYYKNNDSVINRISTLEQPKELFLETKYRNNSIKFEFSALFYESIESTEYSWLLEGYSSKWSKWDKEPKAIFTNLHEGKYNFKVKAKNVYNFESNIAEYSFVIGPPWHRTIWAYIGYVVFGIALIYLIIKLYTRKLVKEKERLEEIVDERTKEIRGKNVELEQQKEEILTQAENLETAYIDISKKNVKIERQHEDITSSIQYASRIQKAILPPYEITTNILSDIFVLFKPRDIVSGDFYWIREKNNKLILVAADCTGHGVPGAFMSMLGISLLNEIISKDTEIHSNIILNKLRELVIKSLHQKGTFGEAQDGMDLAMVIYDKQNNNIQFSGANNPLVLIRNKKNDLSEFDPKILGKKIRTMDNDENVKLIEIKADKMPIGIHRRADKSFVSFEFTAIKDDIIYIFSDGYQDQFGGEKNRKFMIKKLKQMFIDINKEQLSEQKQILDNTLVDWIETGEKENQQLDDIIVIGIRI